MFALLLTALPTNLATVKAAAVETVKTEIDDAQVGTGLNQFEFKGAWVASKDNKLDFKGTEHWTSKEKWTDGMPSVNIRFKGNKIEVFGKKENTGGIYKAVLDGDEANAKKIDTFNQSVQYQERLLVLENLEEKEHTLTLTLLPEVNVLAGTYEAVRVSASLDYAVSYAEEVIDPNKDLEKIVNDHDMGTDFFQFNYSAGWDTSQNYPELFYNGDEHYAHATAERQPSFELKFFGSKIVLYGNKDENPAMYGISVDDGPVEKIDTRSENRLTQQKIYEKGGLADGEHTLKFVTLYESAPGSTGFSSEVDYAVVTHKRIPPTGIEFDKDSLVIEAGLNKTVTAKATPSYATGAAISYEVSDPTIASISELGLVTGLKAGNTTIVAKVNGTDISKSIPLTVTPKGASVVASVGDINYLTTQEEYSEVLEDTKNIWHDVAWRGDVLVSKVNLATKQDAVHNATVTASDFTSGNATISSSAIEINWLRETLANIGRGNGSAPVKPFPDIIHKGGKIDIEGSKVQSAWLNINVPEDATPGTYTGTVTVNADELDAPIILQYSFEVLDIVQPDPKEMDTQVQLWQHPFSVANYYGVAEEDYFEEEHLKYMRESMKEYASLGGKDVVANIVNEAWGHQSYYGDPSMVTWIKQADGTMRFDYDHFDKWIQFNIDAGVLDPEKGIGQIKCFSIVPWDDSFYYVDEASGSDALVKEPANAGDEKWTAYWNAFLSDFMSHVEEKGWFDITYISLDERPMNRVGPAVEIIESIENADGEHFKISSAFNYESGDDYSFLDRLDDVSIGISHVNDDADDMRNLAKHRREKGLLTTIYTCTGDYPGNFTISDMSDNAWGMWYTLSQDTDGYMKWAWDNWVEDPLTNVTYKYWEPGDGWFIYPMEKGTTSGDFFYKTPRYDLFKQGVRDINKAKYLMGKSEELNTSIDEFVKTLVRPEQGGNGYGSAVPATEEDRALTGSEVIRMREGVNQYARKYIESIKVPVTSIAVDKENVELIEGTSVSVQATALPETATNKALTFTSANEKIATVSNTGVITAVSAGETVISVSAENGTVTKDIKVKVILKPTASENDVVIENSDASISVTGNLPETVEMITKMYTDSAFINEIKAKVDAVNKDYFKSNLLLRLFDITLMNEGVVYQPDGSVVVKIKKSSTLIGNNFKVIRINDDGTIVEMDTKVEDDYISFTTDHFSMYAIVSNIKNPSEGEVPTETPTEDENAIKEAGNNSTNTGDSTNVVLWTTIVLCAGAGLLVMKKKKQAE